MKVVAVSSHDDLECRVIIDEYVPLRFRTSEIPFGAGYVRIGPDAGITAELIVEIGTQRVRGFTLIAPSLVAEPPIFCVRQLIRGLPVVDTSFVDYGMKEIDVDVWAAVALDRVVVWWNDIPADVAVIECGVVQFLVSGDELIGAVFSGINGQEMDVFRRAVGL